MEKKALSSKILLPTVNHLNVCEVSGFSYSEGIGQFGILDASSKELL